MMVRLSGHIFWIALLLGVFALLYHTSYKVQELEHQSARARQARQAELETIRVLQAEWTFLTSPARLQRLADKFLTLRPVKPAQVMTRAMLARHLPLRDHARGDFAALTAPGDNPWLTRPGGDVDAR